MGRGRYWFERPKLEGEGGGTGKKKGEDGAFQRDCKMWRWESWGSEKRTTSKISNDFCKCFYYINPELLCAHLLTYRRSFNSFYRWFLGRQNTIIGSFAPTSSEAALLQICICKLFWEEVYAAGIPRVRRAHRHFSTTAVATRTEVGLETGPSHCNIRSPASRAFLGVREGEGPVSKFGGIARGEVATHPAMAQIYCS